MAGTCDEEDDVHHRNVVCVVGDGVGQVDVVVVGSLLRRRRHLSKKKFFATNWVWEWDPCKSISYTAEDFFFESNREVHASFLGKMAWKIPMPVRKKKDFVIISFLIAINIQYHSVISCTN